MSNQIIATDGGQIDLENVAHTFTYLDGVLATDTVVTGGNRYVQTYSYTSGVLTGISAWVKQ